MIRRGKGSTDDERSGVLTLSMLTGIHGAGLDGFIVHKPRDREAQRGECHRCMIRGRPIGVGLRSTGLRS